MWVWGWNVSLLLHLHLMICLHVSKQPHPFPAAAASHFTPHTFPEERLYPHSGSWNRPPLPKLLIAKHFITTPRITTNICLQRKFQRGRKPQSMREVCEILTSYEVISHILLASAMCISLSVLYASCWTPLANLSMLTKPGNSLSGPL